MKRCVWHDPVGYHDDDHLKRRYNKAGKKNFYKFAGNPTLVAIGIITAHLVFSLTLITFPYHHKGPRYDGV